ncbi:DUF2993 domain-containing protein [Cloacibacillus evryensis]|uniref:LmeA family phospholipid-binding protein n=1 Tax=Cloacibacillus evryensis TaxID=508460 RepID=UPI0004BCDEDC|nr:DUF2993 domain-containing protein [Cloacibacillus evryensis]MEA5033907.1 DUF2993 domain-containing protein [Cloacibacillus evryensis]
MKIKKALLCALALTVLPAAHSFAGEREAAAAAAIGALVRGELSPERIEVTVANDGKRAWIECAGAVISGIRIESMKLDAELAELPDDVLSGDGTALSRRITSSRGEIVLSERDVNDYFASGKSSGGFSELRFKFFPRGYHAEGKFETDLMIIKIKLDLRAEGKLGLRADGVYLEDTVIYAEGRKQPENITELVIGRVNPLLPFAKIPFPVSFSRMTMKNGEALLTGEPKKIAGDNVWRWKR